MFRFFLLCCLLVPLIAKPCQIWTKLGESRLQMLFWDVYDAELYNYTGQFEGIEGPLKLTLTYHLDLDAEDIVEETRKQWRKLGINNEMAATWLQVYATTLPNIEEGDQLSFELHQDDSAALALNGRRIQHFDADSLNRQFLAIWLSPQSRYPDLARQLIGAEKR